MTPCAAPARSTPIRLGRCSPPRPCSRSTSPGPRPVPTRALAAAISLACVIGVVYTQSRAALIALLIVALVIGLLHGVRVRVLAIGLCAAIALGALALPQSLQQRVEALSHGTNVNASFRDNNSLRGRTSENLAAVEMWADHPLVGVGPDNFEVHYQTYSATIGIDQRAQARSAHNLYLESFAETGVLGATAFLGVVWLSLSGAWRARTRAAGRDALLCEGIAVALVRLSHLRHDTAQRLRALRVDLPRPWAWPPVTSHGGRRNHCDRDRVAIPAHRVGGRGYPLCVPLRRSDRLRPRHRRRAAVELPLSVVVAAHNEVGVIKDKLSNVLASDYPPGLVELIVAADGCEGRDCRGRAPRGRNARARPAAHGQAVRAQPWRSRLPRARSWPRRCRIRCRSPGTLRRLVSQLRRRARRRGRRERGAPSCRRPAGRWPAARAWTGATNAC